MQAAAQERTYRVDAMSCGGCRGRIVEALDAVEGVERVDVDLATKHVTVRGTASDELIRSSLAHAGYPAAA